MWLANRVLTAAEAAAQADRPGAPPLAVFYATDGMLTGALSGKFDFVSLVAQEMRGAGLRPALVDAGDMASPLALGPADVSVWMIERPAFTRPAGRFFCCFPAYLHGHWYFDTQGVRNNSSIRQAAFDPDSVAARWAAKVFDRLQRRFVATGRTKFDQSAPGLHPPPDGCITIATQTFVRPTHYPTYIQYPDLIAGVLRHRGDRPVAIKPHPLIGVSDARYLLDLHDPVAGVFVADFNLHELLAASAVVVTRCSAVAVEAMLHRVPSLVTGQVDFHHNVTTVRDPAEIGSALNAALTTARPYETYLTWFLTRQLFQPRNVDQTRDRLRDMLSFS